MITLTLGYDMERIATTIKVEGHDPYRYAEVLIAGVPIAPWWNLRRRYRNRQARHRYVTVLARAVDCSEDELDQTLSLLMRQRGVAFV